MRRISCWNDLASWGIVPLTGESCGLGYRILFDVTEQGRSVIGRWLGIPGITLSEAWNRGSDTDPHVGSIMLSHDSLVPLAVFALLAAECAEVWILEGEVLGIQSGENGESRERLRAIYKPRRILKPCGTAGDRNVHAMSGRIT